MTVVVVSVLLSLLPLTLTSQTCNWRLTVVAPEVAAPARPTPVLITIKQLDARLRDAANVSLRLFPDTGVPNNRPLVQTNVYIQDHGVIPLMIPKDVTGQVVLQASVEGSEEVTTSSVIKVVGVVRDVIVRPMSKFYKPGETVEFWILAVDHDLSLTTDSRGKVFMADPQGTKVAVWEEISLDQGVQKFFVTLSSTATPGPWTLGVEVEDSVFTYSLNVSLSRGSQDPLTPDLVIAEEHFVELRFASEMRRRYKPGLPFVGKVEAVSSEKAVRVRVKVLDNQTAIYSQDIEMALGEGAFVVPAILSDSDVITLQAELVSVAGKDTDNHYVLAKEPILKWNSSSSCYLLIEGMERTLEPSDVAKATILSSCPCDHDLHYVITTEGHVTYWSQSEASTEDQNPPSVAVDGAAICRMNFSFTVQPVMAPVSHLLVYYVTRAGEPISDVITFDVKLVQKKASVNVEHRQPWYPGDTMDVAVVTEVGSTVCLVGGRGGEIQENKQMESVDFSQAGLWLAQHDCGRGGGGGVRHSSLREPRRTVMLHSGLEQLWLWHCFNYTNCGCGTASTIRVRHSSLREPRRTVMLHSGLEQLWLWHCFNYTTEVEATGLTVPAPPLPGKWTLFALILSPAPGRRLQFSPPASLSVFRPVEVEFRLAPSINVGESLEVDVKIGNNVNSCVDVNALLSLNEGAHFAGVNQPFVAEKLRLGPQGATSLVIKLVATSPGLKKMTVEVSAFISETCQTISDSSGAHGNHSLVSTVVRSAEIMVYHEGLVRSHTESAYFCANEKMMISEPENFKFEFVPAPRNREGLVFEVRAAGGVHIALSEHQATTATSYLLVIDNDVSYIARGKHGYGVHLVSAETHGVLSTEESRTFWVSWERGSVSCGRGFVFHSNTLLKWKMNKKTKVAFVGFTTSWRKKADFRIWNYNEEAGFSQVLHLDVPHSVLPGSESGTLLVNGGLYLADLPSALGPQSLAEYSSLATAIARLAPLVLGNMSSNASDAQLRSLSTHIQNLLVFRQEDGSFGDHVNVSSLWATLQSLDILSRAQSYLGIDPDILSKVKDWLRGRQAKDGSLSPCPSETTVDNASELSQKIQATAETLTTLIGIGVETEEDSEMVLKSRYFLERNVYHVNEGCPLAMLAHALVMANSELARLAMERLGNVSTNEEGDFGWPRPPENTDWLYEEGVAQTSKPVLTASVTDYKASLYTLMAYTLRSDLKAAEQVARYLFYRSHVLDRHPELMLTALKAFYHFDSLASDPHRSLTLSLATSGMELTDTIELRPDSGAQRLPLPSLPTKVFVYATGAGCATVQGRVTYATYSPAKSNAVLDISAVVEQEILPSLQEMDGKLPILDIKTCFRWKGSEPSGVIRGELHLFSGFQLTSFKPSKTLASLRYGADGDKVWFSLLDVNSSCSVCVRLTIHSDFVVRGLRPALARVYPATRPDLAVETFFTSPLLTDSDEDYITWFNSHSGSQEDQLVEVRECEQNEEDSFMSNLALATVNPEVYNDDLTLTDVIILSDLNSDANTTSSPEDTQPVTEEVLMLSSETTKSERKSDPSETSDIVAIKDAEVTMELEVTNTPEVTNKAEATNKAEVTNKAKVLNIAEVTNKVEVTNETEVTQGTPSAIETIKESPTSQPQEENTTTTPLVTERPLKAQPQPIVNLKVLQKGKQSEKKEIIKKTKLSSMKKSMTKSVQKGYEKADDLLTKEIIYVVREDVSNFTSSVPKKGPKPILDKGEIVIQDPNQTMPEEEINVTHSPVEVKKVNHVTGQVREPALLQDSVTGPSHPGIAVQESATVAKAVGDRVLVLDKNALWGMLREGSKPSEDLKKGG
ncbi:C3 and PZP-like alpha-2-macroglobulin domain-containing protein 8 [Macrosteles quadrilineatus]|uniref:C3 and PZP-like alpha-2-macroglobulin domain-containing protein 8 n=1 Tax=Macrosteles quadrilineatus TaxID=74068 RepID=UPI0023E32191|nr:C3 and PZP-like alpha-2-macroglobulin domain-containing protein 8 [Macrosteles quadrilineatus]